MNRLVFRTCTCVPTHIIPGLTSSEILATPLFKLLFASNDIHTQFTSGKQSISPFLFSVFIFFIPFLRPNKKEQLWRECPKYVPSEKECFFDKNHTQAWKTYCVQLRTRNNVTYYNDDDCFLLEHIG